MKKLLVLFLFLFTSISPTLAQYYPPGGGGGGSGTVTNVSVVSANGLNGTVANATTTPALTLKTTITGLLQGNGTAISAATAGTDYQVPITLTTTGTSGAATFAANTLNIPQYSGGGGSPGGSSGQIQYNNASSFGGFTMSGDATLVTSTGVITVANNAVTTAKINNNAVTLAKLATQADQTILGNVSGGAAVPVALTATQLTAIPNLATDLLQGVLPALTDAKIIVGKTASAVQAVTMSGGATISNTGVVVLGNPGASTLGGIQSYAAVTNQWINTISTSGVPSSTQPAFSNLSGSATLAQFPTIANNTVLGNVSGGTAVPTATSAPVVTSLTAPVTVQTITTDSDGATITFNLATSNWHNVVLAGNRTLALSNATTGQQFTIQLTQDGTGSRTVTWFSGITWNGGTSAPTLQTAANAIDTITFKCTGSGAYIGYPTYQNIFTNITATHQIGGGTAPTIAAGAGAGTSPTISIAGHDTDFAITLTTGSAPSGTNAVIATVTFGTAYASAPYVQVTDGNANTAGLATALLQTYPTSTTTTMVLNSGTTGLTGSTQYIWNVHCGQ